MIANPNITATQQVKPADGETLLWACDQRDPRTLGQGLLNDARNLRFADGLPTTRKGVVKPAWANVCTGGSLTIGSFGTPYGAGVFRDPDGVEWQIVAAGGSVWRTRPGNMAVVIPLPAGVQVVSTCRFVQAFDMLFCFRGRYLAPLVLSDLDTGFLDLLPQYNAITGGSLGGGVYQAAVVASGTAADQMAYGPFQSVASLTYAAGVVTCSTVVAHGYVTGADVTIKGASPAQFNGRVPITVVDDYTFTYPLANNTATSATGTILVSNNAQYWTAAGSQVTLSALAAQAVATFTLSKLTAPVALTPTSLTSGPNVFAITQIVHFAYKCTATAPNHGMNNGDLVTVTGATLHTGENVTNAVATVIDPDTFTYTVTADAGSTITDTESGLQGSSAYGLTATATTATAHGLTTGETVTIAGATPAVYNGTVSVTVVRSPRPTGRGAD